MRSYRSTDLVNWEDEGLLIPPRPDKPGHPLHPASMMDRPHVVRCPRTGKYVAWLMGYLDWRDEWSPADFD